MILITKIIAFIAWIISVIMWIITLKRENKVCKANFITAQEFYSFLEIVFCLFIIMGAAIINILGVK